MRTIQTSASPGSLGAALPDFRMRFNRRLTELLEAWIEIARVELSPGVRPFRAQKIRDLFLNIRDLSKNLGARVLLCDWLTESQTDAMRLRAAQTEGEPRPVSPPREGADPPRVKAILEMVAVEDLEVRSEEKDREKEADSKRERRRLTVVVKEEKEKEKEERRRRSRGPSPTEDVLEISQPSHFKHAAHYSNGRLELIRRRELAQQP